MSLDIYPRRAIPDRVLLISRRTHELRMGMVPRIGVALIQMFILFRVALETGMRLHAFAFLPNQYQLVISEPRNHSRVSEFIERLNRYLARVFNARNRTRGYFWDSDPTLIIELLDRESVKDAIVDTLTMAQRAGLSNGPGNWVGLESSVESIGGAPLHVDRPASLGRQLPPFLELTLAKPKFFEDLTDAEFREILGSRLRAVTLAIRRDRRRRGLSVRSPGAIVNTDWRQVPAAEPEDVCRRAREDSPFRGALELCRQAERALEEFREAYRIARDRWRSGDHTVVFPRGTDALRRRHGARIAPAA